MNLSRIEHRLKFAVGVVVVLFDVGDVQILVSVLKGTKCIHK